MINDVQAATDSDMWYTLFLSEINKHAPLKTKRIKYAHQPIWLTDEIKDTQKKRFHFSFEQSALAELLPIFEKKLFKSIDYIFKITTSFIFKFHRWWKVVLFFRI
jgi:hypothetical protein